MVSTLVTLSLLNGNKLITQVNKFYFLNSTITFAKTHFTKKYYFPQ